MSFSMAPFEVASASLAEPAKVHFVRLMPGIATRHSDTIDIFFRVNGRPALVAISCATLSELDAKESRHFTDQQLVDIAGQWLHRTLAAGYDATVAELFLGGADFRSMAKELGYY